MNITAQKIYDYFIKEMKITFIDECTEENLADALIDSHRRLREDARSSYRIYVKIRKLPWFLQKYLLS